MGRTPIPLRCMNQGNLERDVFAFLERETRNGQIDWDMDLRGDLGIDGDDADELLQRFCVAFEVYAQDFPFSEHFGPEAGFEPITWLLAKLLGWTRKLKPLTVRALVEAAERGRFDWPP